MAEDGKPKRLEVPVSLGKPSLRIRLEAYYSLINPESILDPVKWRSTFQQIYEKYGGSYEGERKLASKLANKYGHTTVRLLLAESVLEDKKKRKVASERSEEVKDESWYDLGPMEQGSNVIDFTSNRFDPRAALRVPAGQIAKENPWVPQSQLLNHLGQFCSSLPRTDPLFKEAIIHHHSNQKKNKPQSKTEEKPRKLGPFAAIAENHKGGPWSMLHRLFSKRQRVRVLIRYVNSLRGTLTGYIVAYDKHCNMILRDVDEVYSPRHCSSGSNRGEMGKGKEEEKEEPSNLEAEMNRRRSAMEQTRSRKPAGTEWQLRQRHMKQILVRGDNVVMIYKAESERSAWPPTSKSPKKSVHGRKVVVVPKERRVGSPGSLIYTLQQQARRQTQNQRFD